MEDVKWLLKKYGLLIVLMVIIVVICSIIFGKRGSEKNAEEVWEPPVEIHLINENEILSNNIAEENIEESAATSKVGLHCLVKAFLHHSHGHSVSLDVLFVP